MRHLITILLMLFISVAWPGEAKLTMGADAALAKYNNEVAKAKADMDNKVAASRDALFKVLTAEQERLTKAGNLDGALAIRAKMTDLTKNDPDPVAGLLGPVTPKEEPAVPTTDLAIKIPANVKWAPYNAKTGVRSCFELGPFPKGIDTTAVLGYLSAGDFKKGFMGIDFAKGTADGSGNFNCADQDNTDTFWVVYLKAAKEPVEVMAMAKANPADKTNVSSQILDGKLVKDGAKMTITSAGHIFVLHQGHKAAYRDATIRFLTESQLLVGAP